MTAPRRHRLNRIDNCIDHGKRCRRLAASLVLVPSALWLVGFALFITLLPRPPVTALAGDCVAVASGVHDRLITAIEVYADRADIFVSGAHEGTNHIERDDMRARAPKWFDQHVSFGQMARNTRENGIEISAWAQQRTCRVLVLVSDDAHLPRVHLALRRAGYAGPAASHAVARVFDDQHPWTERLLLAARAWSRFAVALAWDW